VKKPCGVGGKGPIAHDEAKGRETARGRGFCSWEIKVLLLDRWSSACGEFLVLSSSTWNSPTSAQVQVLVDQLQQVSLRQWIAAAKPSPTIAAASDPAALSDAGRC
jgi:hypothetical protein